MSPDLSGIIIAVVGGDHRQLAVIEALQECGAHIRGHALPKRSMANHVEMFDSLDGLVAGADALLLPISGTDENGMVRTIEGVSPVYIQESDFQSIKKGTLLVTGSLRPRFKAALAAGVHVLEYAEEDEIATLNSIPTAEGAIQVAMQELPITVHGSRSFVLGFGRCGITLARMLQALGAKTIVFARRAAQLARAFEMGLESRHLDRLPDEIGEAQIIYNSIPARVLDEALLAGTDPNVLIIDIASSPGGTDFDAAARLGRRAVLALGLPGKVAPKTAGQILASALPGLIGRALASR